MDRFIAAFDKALRTVYAPARALRAPPVTEAPDAQLSAQDRVRAGRLMRVNHTGEVCAQALYQGQGLTARNDAIKQSLERASREEEDHLAWCETRLAELGSRKSLLNPAWYAGSFALGALSGLLGDRWNLAFLAETERQVEGHLKSHLDRLPQQDTQSRAIVEQMRQDEAQHALSAKNLGAAEMPAPVRSAMRIASKLMTTTTHWL